MLWLQRHRPLDGDASCLKRKKNADRRTARMGTADAWNQGRKALKDEESSSVIPAATGLSSETTEQSWKKILSPDAEETAEKIQEKKVVNELVKCTKNKR